MSKVFFSFLDLYNDFNDIKMIQFSACLTNNEIILSESEVSIYAFKKNHAYF